MTIARVGVDIAKSVFHVHGVDRHEQVLWTGKYSRRKWPDALCRRVPAGASKLIYLPPAPEHGEPTEAR
ncbi:hypothetical protein Msub_20491 [Marinobacter subterrani]|uniref:Transposase n=1 Tax=Marinobacter subterrani TaxID=1658765 RepID=A0A0J7J5Q4_9GAMM|nr:hypothetical protein Msub_20491 [Marinobacter subterrani]